MILNPSTGLVSPQFHVSYDDFFESVRINKDRESQPPLWQELSGLKGRDRAPRSIDIALTRPRDIKAALQQPPQVEDEDVNPATYTQDTNSNISNEGEDQPSTIQELGEDPDYPPAVPDNNQETVNNEPSNPMSFLRSTSRSGRQIRPTAKMKETLERGDYTAFESIFIDGSTEQELEEYYDALHKDDYEIQDDMKDPIAFLAKSDRDTMYYHQAMKQPDKIQFQHAMEKEFLDHSRRKYWELCHLDDVPKGTKILDSIWSMKRKRDILTRKIIKWKARLTVHGGQQEYGVNYTETYSPVASWYSIRMLLTLATLHNWHTRQVDFVLAYPQAPIEHDIYMKLLIGLKFEGIDKSQYCLRLKKNIYGQKQAGRIWNHYLVDGLKNIGFKQSKAGDECVFYRGDVIFFVYVDDVCFISPNKESVEKAISDLKKPSLAKHKYDIEDRGDISDYLGINFRREKKDGTLHLTQPQLIDQILEEVGIDENVRIKPTPVASTKLLTRDIHLPKFNNAFTYRRVIGQLNYLEKGTRPDIAYAVHQYARFCSDPRKTHADAVLHLCKYLQGTRDKGIIINPSTDLSLKCYADADFIGNYHKHTAAYDASTAKSRTGFIIFFAECPIIWTSKLQTCIALSSCESEYYALSQALRDMIPIMELLKEINSHGFTGNYIPPQIHCKAFEDNSGALHMANIHKMRPRTKHINQVYHHFRSHVRSGEIVVHAISTVDQIADILTKPLDQNTFVRLRKKYLKW